ncbi:hypothetical protein QQF64_024093 [Cirrhinus molitorella]|uniref:Uncharacterized protein n=1 Tax=Cirrhinus molitorella TaxID=172907 RepID=A0ABR3NLH6_9TELE
MFRCRTQDAEIKSPTNYINVWELSFYYKRHNAEIDPLQNGAVNPSFGLLVADRLGRCKSDCLSWTVLMSSLIFVSGADRL